MKTIVNAIQSTRNKSAKFYKVDLHIHSRESHDFPKIDDKKGSALTLTDVDHNSKEQDYLVAANRSGLRLMAITDHNKSRFAVQLAKYARDNKSNIVVLPGMEVTIQTTIFPDSAIHVLAIFPDDFSSEDIQSIFTTKSGMPNYDRRTDASLTSMPLDEFINIVHDKHGICIASHVNSSKGVRSIFRDINAELLRTNLEIKFLKNKLKKDIDNQELKTNLAQLVQNNKNIEDDVQNAFLKLLSDFNFDAVEVQKSRDDQFYKGNHAKSLGIRDIPCILSSDSHNIQDIGLRDFTTYIKMTTPGFLDLRKALKDPGTRIRYENTLKKKQYPRILGINIDGQFFKKPTIGFSDNLTCLIGGRGTGKSTTIEALRRTFDIDLSYLEPEKRKDIDGRKKHALTDTKITVLFENEHGERVILVDENGAESKCFDSQGVLQSDVKVSQNDELKVKIYGWGEIEELARNKREQLKLIDGFIPESREINQIISDLLSKLEKNTTQIFGLAKDVEDLLPKIAELKAKQTQLTSLSTPDLDLLFSEFDQNESALSAITSLDREVLDLSDKIKENGRDKHVFGTKLEQFIQLTQTKIQKMIWSEAFTSGIKKQADAIQPAYEHLLNLFEELSAAINSQSKVLESNRQSLEANLVNKAKDLIGGEYEGNSARIIERRSNLTKEVAELTVYKNDIDAKHDEILNLLKIRFNEVIPNLIELRARLTEVRKSKIQEINQRLSALSNVAKVTIDVLYQSEKSEFVDALGSPEPKKPDGILKGVSRWYKKYNYAGLYAQKFSPHEFVQAILYPKDDFLNLVATGQYQDNAVEINAEMAKSIATYLSPYSQDKPYFDPEKLNNLLYLEHLDIQDLPVISLDGQRIEELSPGQRCSTLIPIILLESTCPLIIDQPEDNLDNKLVFDLVVDILRSLKEQRQIIVATHNPNIPVSGDAEQIIVFDAPSREECTIIGQGSIDDPEIVHQIKAIMEGSDEAFRIRAEKYGYYLNALEQNFL